jgi:hypothetical protein
MKEEKSRLSYVELATVLVALSIVSMQVVPKFTQATEASRTDELIQGLQQMRNALKLYSVHNENPQPPTDSYESFEAALTDTDGRREPYVQKIPVNPYNSLDTVRFDGKPAGANLAGWRFDTVSGLFQADNSRKHAVL